MGINDNFCDFEIVLNRVWRDGLLIKGFGCFYRGLRFGFLDGGL